MVEFVILSDRIYARKVEIYSTVDGQKIKLKLDPEGKMDKEIKLFLNWV